VEYAVMSRAEAEELTVGEAMLSRPKTLPANATVGEVRRAFSANTMRMVLLVDGGAFAGALVRGDLPDTADDAEPASAYASTDAPRVAPGVPVREALGRIEGADEGRLVVVDDDGVTLRGLICLKRAADTLCVDR
jgi:CBS domain-containing protein